MGLLKTLMIATATISVAACGNDSANTPAPSQNAAAANASAASPIDREFTLAGAEEVSPDTIIALLSVGDNNPPTYDHATFDKSIGAVVFENLRFADANDGDGLIVTRAEFFGVDADNIEKIKDTSLAAIDADFVTAFQRVRLFDISTFASGEDEGQLSIGALEFDSLALREGGVNDALEIDAGAQFFNAVSLAGLYMKDFAVTLDNDDGNAVGFSVPDLRLVEFGGGKLKAFIANGLNYSVSQSPEVINAIADGMAPQVAAIFSGPLANFLAPGTQETSIESFEWRDIDASGALAWSLKDEDAPTTQRDLIDLGTFEAINAVSVINGKQFAFIKETKLAAASFIWMMPSDIRLTTKDAIYDFTAYIQDEEDPAHAILTANGLNEVTGDGIASWKWDDKSGAGAFAYEANTTGLADLALSIDVSDVTLNALAAAAKIESDTPVGALKNFNLAVKDEALLDTIFEISALQTGGNAATLRNAAPAMLRLSALELATYGPEYPRYVNAVADFISEGGLLTISAEPEEPLAFTALQSIDDPTAFPKILSLQIAHEK